MIKKTPSDIFGEYRQGIDYDTSISLFENVEKNQRFYNGEHWQGVNAPDLIKPVFNLIKRVVSYFVAMIVSDDIGIKISPFDETQEALTTANILTREIDHVIENTKFKEKTREIIKNSCVDGDAAFYFAFNPDIETGQDLKGAIEVSLIDNTNIFFGNPYESDVQRQPYIIVQQRLYTDQVKEMARKEGVSEEEIQNIISDADDTDNVSIYQETADKLTTVITKFWKETKIVKENILGVELDKKVETIHFIKCTSKVILKDDTDTGYNRYPIAYMSWEKVKKSYHGRSPITGVIPNQVFINKLFAMCMVYVTNNGFPRVLYDVARFGKSANSLKGYNASNLDLLGKFMDASKAPDFSNQVIQLISDTIAYTKEFLGANDAALGNVKPDNTSAIIAVQQASAVPLQLQKLAFYEFVEDSVRIIMDIMSCDYGTRSVKINAEESEKLGLSQLDPSTNMMVPVTNIDLDFSLLTTLQNSVNVSVGESSYWSELMNIQTMDNLFAKNIITNPIDYLESVPDKYLSGKQKLIDSLKEQQQQADQLNGMMQLLQQYAPPEVLEQLNMSK